MSEDKLSKINEMSQELIKLLRAEYDPYTEIIVTADGIYVKQQIIGIPLLKIDD